MYKIVFIIILILIAVRSTKQMGVFLGKCVHTATKAMVVDRKKQKALALLHVYLGSGLLRNTVNSSVVPTEFAAEPTTKIKSSRQI